MVQGCQDKYSNYVYPQMFLSRQTQIPVWSICMKMKNTKACTVMVVASSIFWTRNEVLGFCMELRMAENSYT